MSETTIEKVQTTIRFDVSVRAMLDDYIHFWRKKGVKKTIDGSVNEAVRRLTLEVDSAGPSRTVASVAAEIRDIPQELIDWWNNPSSNKSALSPILHEAVAELLQVKRPKGKK